MPTASRLAFALASLFASTAIAAPSTPAPGAGGVSAAMVGNDTQVRMAGGVRRPAGAVGGRPVIGGHRFPNAPTTQFAPVRGPVGAPVRGPATGPAGPAGSAASTVRPPPKPLPPTPRPAGGATASTGQYGNVPTGQQPGIYTSARPAQPTTPGGAASSTSPYQPLSLRPPPKPLPALPGTVASPAGPILAPGNYHNLPPGTIPLPVSRSPSPTLQRQGLPAGQNGGAPAPRPPGGNYVSATSSGAGNGPLPPTVGGQYGNVPTGQQSGNAGGPPRRLPPPVPRQGPGATAPYGNVPTGQVQPGQAQPGQPFNYGQAQFVQPGQNASGGRSLPPPPSPRQ